MSSLYVGSTLGGWRVWISFCANVGCRPGSPSLEQLRDFLASLAEGAVLDRGRSRKRSALSVLSGLTFAAFKFQLSELEKLPRNVLLCLPGGTPGSGSAIRQKRRFPYFVWLCDGQPLALELWEARFKLTVMWMWCCRPCLSTACPSA